MPAGGGEGYELTAAGSFSVRRAACATTFPALPD